jgi:hypothetical protein
MVRDRLESNPAKWKRFLDYEAPLTRPEQIRNPGGHYRGLLKNFCAAETNTRIEQRRAKREGGWHCPDAVERCKNSLIEDENGVPVRLCSCARHLTEKDREKRHSAVREAAVIYAAAG